ncbi:DUF2569 domain-containing protein [Paenibacillus sp. 19GGS1-52]|uniref:DUF2569 domain-containing protein n=1 Tax=Paenibacillus sp. 19GGS1-52 TaxID=2758563 RepID=UPI001EFB9223|nr:DUF2569 domain-containing protein [Paenibacillus sp. 19GGS1-52]ULO07010.1 DUF2569 domain-containing protein [Paenibacillus sp. 19GGS1-52]
MGTMIPGNERMEIVPNKPSGLGGWMILVQIGLYVSIFRIIALIFNYVIPSFKPEIWDALTSPDSPAYDSMWKPSLIFESVANVVFVLFSIFLLVLLYQKKSTFPRWAIFYYVTNLLVLIVDYVLMANIEVLQTLDEGNSTQDIGRLAVSCAIWIPYFIRSKRVHNTFIH